MSSWYPGLLTPISRPKRKVFISYHHANDQFWMNQFSNTFCDGYDVFSDNSLDRQVESDDVDYLARVCRDNIYGTSVTIVLCGTETGLRKFVDWEIDYTLSCEHGLLGILVPGVTVQQVSIPLRLLDNIESGYAGFMYYPTDAASLRSAIERAATADKSLIKNTRTRRYRNG